MGVICAHGSSGSGSCGSTVYRSFVGVGVVEVILVFCCCPA